MEGYEAIEILYEVNSFGGLEYNDAEDSLLDGSIGSDASYYALGSTVAAGLNQT